MDVGIFNKDVVMVIGMMQCCGSSLEKICGDGWFGNGAKFE